MQLTHCFQILSNGLNDSEAHILNKFSKNKQGLEHHKATPHSSYMSAEVEKKTGREFRHTICQIHKVAVLSFKRKIPLHCQKTNLLLSFVDQLKRSFLILTLLRGKKDT